MSQLSSDSLVARNTNTAQVIGRVVEGEALLISLESGHYFTLNSVGTRIWENLDGHNTIGDLREVIVSEYDISAERAYTDIINLVNDLVEEGLAVLA